MAIIIKGREYPQAGEKIRIPASGFLKSPSFSRSYPRVINKELIEPNHRNWMEGFWRKDFFEERNLEVFHIGGAYLVNECLVLDEELRVIENASDDYPDEEIARAIAYIAKETGAEGFFATQSSTENNVGRFAPYADRTILWTTKGQSPVGIDFVKLCVHSVELCVERKPPAAPDPQ